MPNVKCISMEKVTIDVRKSIFETASQVVVARKARKEEASAASGLYKGAAFGDDEDDDDDYSDVRTKDLLVIHMPELKVSIFLHRLNFLGCSS